MAKDSDYGVNDLGLKIATVNGTGSASANGLLLQALFRMGIPVSGKNVFPSNIQGLPTWYEVRVNKDGYTARSPDFQLVVAMNPESYARDIEEVVSGGWVLYDNTRKLDDEFRRDDVTFLGIPLAGMCVEHFQGSRIRILMKNITYVGALVALLDIDMDVVKGMLQEKFAAKQHLMDANFTAIALGHEYAEEHFDCPLPIRLEAMDQTRDCVMVTGNAAAACTGTARAEHYHLVDNDGGPVLGPALALGLRVFDAALHVEPVTLLHPLLDDVDQASEEGQPVPLGLLLLLTGAVGPGPIRGHGKLGYACA